MIISNFNNSYATEFTLSNDSGMTVVLTDIGADIVKIIVPDKDGNPVDVALGYDEPEHYVTNKTTFGAIVGRYANRIGGAQFTLNGVTYKLDVNDNDNCLHGGFNKWYSRTWFPTANEADNSVTFRLFSPDGDQGMPGNATISVTYKLTDDNALSIRYEAVSDKDTYFNLTNHNYFNLSGEGTETMTDHTMWIDADKATAIDSQLIPTGEIVNIKGTALDFTTEKVISKDIDADEEAIKLGGGFDHNFILNNPSLSKPFARVSSPRTGIVMEVFTDLPAVQFYSGNFMGSDPNGKGGKAYAYRSGFALETQYYPDTPNHPDFPGSLFRAGEKLESTTVYKFSVN
ncbi:MAG: aldose epimerase family protein [Lachnospiraceae bacterium]|nr:aldose epimerase family protein [Lachnospiraceae bacterium]